jgi:hypothetical protein
MMKIKRFQEGGVPKVSKKEKMVEMQANDQAARQFIMEFMNSPMYKEMATRSAMESGMNPEELMSRRMESIQSLPDTKLVTKDNPERLGQYNPYRHRTTIFGEDSGGAVNAHEFSHATDLEFGKYGGMGIPSVDEVLMTSSSNPVYAPFISNYMEGTELPGPSPEEFLSAIQDTPQFDYIASTFFPKGRDPQEFFSTEEGKQKLGQIYELVGTAALPMETRARLNAMRFLAKEAGIYDPNTQPINKDQLGELLNLYEKDPMKYQQIRQMNIMYTPQQIMEMLNRISYTPEELINDKA